MQTLNELLISDAGKIFRVKKFFKSFEARLLILGLKSSDLSDLNQDKQDFLQLRPEETRKKFRNSSQNDKDDNRQSLFCKRIS